MNQFFKLRHYSSFIRKFCGVAFKHTCNDCIYYSLGMQTPKMIDSLSLPYTFSYCQVRKFAKRVQGKASKGGKGKTMKLTDEEMADVIDLDDYRQQLHKVTEKLKQDYIKNFSIHSLASNIINITVKIAGEDYPLNELAVIAKKNPNLIAINMVDFPEAIKPAIQAIIDSGSSLNPQQDGTMIYLTVPKMTREQREILVKNAKSVFIRAKEEIRLIQNSFVKGAKSKTGLSEDLLFNASKQIMAMADLCTVDLEKIMKEKQKELLGDS